MIKVALICCIVFLSMFRRCVTQSAFANAAASVGSRPGLRDTSTAEAFASANGGGSKPLNVPTSVSSFSRIPLATAFPWAFLPTTYSAFPAYAPALANQFPFGVPVAIANAIYAPNNLLRGINTNEGNTEI